MPHCAGRETLRPYLFAPPPSVGVTTTRIGKANAAFQQLQALRSNRTQRHRQARFLVEGVRPIDQAVAHQWEILAWIYDPEAPGSRWRAERLAATAGDRIELTADLLGALSDKDDTSELLALVGMAPDDLERIGVGGGLVVAFDAPGSPGNVGSVIRSADALGADGVVLTGHAADPYDPQAVRASTGSLFAVPVVTGHAPTAVGEWARGQGLTVVGTDEAGEVALAELDLRAPVMVVFGNEARGLSAAWRSACDVTARIPMKATGSASSLNVATAVAITLYEAGRQRA